MPRSHHTALRSVANSALSKSFIAGNTTLWDEPLMASENVCRAGDAGKTLYRYSHFITQQSANASPAAANHQ
ncbi:MAG: hypothetical protein GWP30_09430 [Actinobacteria bacterium]|nr:hypothetical protein [Actinomycetota bacterium]